MRRLASGPTAPADWRCCVAHSVMSQFRRPAETFHARRKSKRASMRAKSACLAFAALVFSGAAASREPEVSLTEIDASRWKIAYRLDAPAEALHFARTLPELRGLCRRPADKAFGVSGAADAETRRRRSVRRICNRRAGRRPPACNRIMSPFVDSATSESLFTLATNSLAPTRHAPRRRPEA